LKIDRSLLRVLILNALGLGLFLPLFTALPLPALIPCAYPPAQSIAFALCVSLVLHLLLIRRISVTRSQPVILGYALLLVLAFWLGSYPLSPLGFASGRIPVLKGFKITRFGRPELSIASGQIVTIAGNSITEIQPITLPVDRTCTWVSAKGGALDEPRNCDVAYFSPGGAISDTLRLLVQPGCHLPNSVGEIRFSILP
jgi:hypothetical protein